MHNPKKSTGLVLSGGGAKGIAHLGVIKALEEHDIRFDVISGTSAGAIVGALYASGYTTNDILNILLETKPFKLIQPALNTKGLLKMESIHKFLEKHLRHNDFKKLKIPLYVAATNIRTGSIEYFSEGELITAVCASSCIPVLFNPVEYRGEKYMDGGILNNLPVEAIRDKVDTVISVNTNPIDPDFEIKTVPGIMERALMLAISKNTYISAEKCDLIIEPARLSSFKALDISQVKEIFRIGYQEGMRQLQDINR